MKNIRTLILFAINSVALYPMQKVPFIATNAIISQLANIQKNISKQSSHAAHTPLNVISLDKKLVESLQQETIEDLKPSYIHPNLSFKAPAGGMFKATQPLLSNQNSYSSNQNPYDILGINESELFSLPSKAERLKCLNNAYKNKAKKLHPDVNKATDSNQKFRELMQAKKCVETLINKNQRYSNDRHSDWENTDYDYSAFNHLKSLRKSQDVREALTWAIYLLLFYETSRYIEYTCDKLINENEKEIKYKLENKEYKEAYKIYQQTLKTYIKNNSLISIPLFLVSKLFMPSRTAFLLSSALIYGICIQPLRKKLKNAKEDFKKPEEALENLKTESNANNHPLKSLFFNRQL